jgi:hypothetical protein
VTPQTSGRMIGSQDEKVMFVFFQHVRLENGICACAQFLIASLHGKGHLGIIEWRIEICQHGYVQNVKLNTLADVGKQHTQTAEHLKKNMQKRAS